MKANRVVTTYMEKYHARKVGVAYEHAKAVLDGASSVYLVERGEITIPGLDQQRRQVCTLRFERILTDPEVPHEG